MSTHKKKLILITASYPFGLGETFIENEIIILSKYFDKITILSNNDNSLIKRPTPSNVSSKSIVLPKTSFIHWLSLTKIDFIKEFAINLITNPLKNKIAIKSWIDAYKKAKYIQSFIEPNTILYSYWLDDNAIALAMLSKQQKRNISISRAHGWDVYTERHLFDYLPFRAYLNNLQNVYSISKNGEKELEKQGMHNVQISRLGTLKTNTPYKSISSKSHHTSTTIISIASAVPLKRIQLLMDALTHIHDDIPKLKWIHFGDGPLLKFFKKNSAFIKKHITIDFKGHVSNVHLKKELSALYSKTILVNTSSSEGIPVSMMEAMSCGIPCIGTNVGGVSEIIEDGQNGYLMPANPTPREVANFILRFNNLSVEEKQTMQKNAYHTWNEKYNADKNYTAFAKMLQRL